MPAQACRHCGAIGPCYSGCQCYKCIDPHGYEAWVRNQPGNWPSKAQADQANRLRLEMNGQQTMLRKMQDADKMFVSLKDKWSLILVRALEAVKSAKDSWSMLQALLQAFSALSADVIQFAKG